MIRIHTTKLARSIKRFTNSVQFLDRIGFNIFYTMYTAMWSPNPNVMTFGFYCLKDPNNVAWGPRACLGIE